MKNSKFPTFTFAIIAIILGFALKKDFDIESLTFKNPGIAIIYGIVFLFSVYALIKNRKNRAEK